MASIVVCTPANRFGRHRRGDDEDVTSILPRRLRPYMKTSALTRAPLTHPLITQDCILPPHKALVFEAATRYHASDYQTPDAPVSYTRSSAKPLRSSSGRPKSHRHGSDAADPHRVKILSEVPDVKTRSYHLEIVQHPIKTAEFANSTLSRLPLAPPLIAQLHVHGHTSPTALDESELPFLIAHLSLYSADGTTAVDLATDGAHALPERMLYGSLVSSPHVFRNLQGRQGVYFLFPDVSIRWRGQFQLSVTLIQLPGLSAPGSTMMEVDNEQGVVLDSVKSHTFDVHARTNYVAPAQTPLTQFFLQQGARMTTSTLCAPRRPL